MFGYYYNKSLRKLVVGFGTLFNNIYVSHENETDPNTTLRVPITYASQEKFIQRLLNPSSITDGTRIENQLPRISYHVNSIVPDPSRRRARFSSAIALSPSGSSCNNTGTQIANEQPVNVGINLFAYTRHIDDMLQIVEQIIPFFVPDHIIKITLTDSGDPINIPIVMVSNNLTDKYEGDFNSRRLHIASFNFVAKSYIFGGVSNVTTINQVDESVDFRLE
jgi:hypothetical protein